MEFRGMDLVVSTCIVILSFAVHSNADGGTNGYLNFFTHHVYVPEKQYEVATFNLRREGGSSGLIFFYCKIINSTSTTDFVSNTAAGTFADGATQSTCQFTVVEDSIPEPNITYSVGIVIQGGGAEIGTSNASFVTILSNDDPFGSIGFEVPNERVTVAEPLDGQVSTASFDVVRLKGSIGTSTIFYKVDNGRSSAIIDIINPNGSLTFHDGERRKKLNVSIRPDNKPENAMQFTVELLSVSGGATLNETAKRASLTIEENDYPLQFDKSTEQASESQTLSITVRRGLLGEGRVATTVNYNTVDGTAKAGVDYTPASGTLSYGALVTSKTISVTILKDPLPEIAENFTVVLSNPSSNSVLVSPHILTIVIQKNDDPHGVISFLELNETQSLILDEDRSSTGVVKVNRSRGTIGTVVINWRVVPGPMSLGVLPNSVLAQSKGNLTFGPEVSLQEFSLTVRPDNTPEEAVELYVELMNVTGGARFTPTTPRAKVIIRDSDIAYGVVTLGSQSEHRVVLSSTPRKIFASVRRSGGALAAIRVNYTVHYLMPGSSMPSSDIPLIHPRYVTIERGSHNATIEIQIGENGFLKSNAAFLVRLDTVQVEKSTIIAPKTPVLGTPTSAFINITSELANGEISFFNNPVNMIVDEPVSGQLSKLSVLVMRDGVSGPATVYWTLRPTKITLTSADVSPWNGTVYFAKGTDRVNLTISILPDDIPELDESFTLELTNVTERNERLRTGGTIATVTIKRNDNAGGIFEFNHTGSIILQENDAARIVDIVRTGGALTIQRVKAEIISGQNDFIAHQSILLFNANERKKSFYVFPNDDAIPEINETFILRLTSIDGTVLGNRTSIEITILQNDDANGIFSFDNAANNLIKYAAEVRTMSSQISFDVKRNRGTFGTVSVYWNVTSLSGARASLDILHLTGTVVFNPRESSKQLNIVVKPDQIPEGEERFQIRLISVNNGGKLASPVLATLIINPNDAPIQFLYPLHVRITEGQTANFTIGLNRTLSESITVYYSTIDVTASSSAGDYMMVHNKPVVFAAGERNKTISLQTIDDDVAEIAEEFIVRLNGSTGDTVLIPPTDATVTIEPNDEPYGIFEFAQNSLNKTANEGSTVNFVINRSRGTFTNVTLNWEILSSSRLLVADGSEFMKTRGSLLFHEGLSSEILSLLVRSDGIPELNETFYVRIVNVTDNRGRLGNQTEAVVTILPNDDPYGVFQFAPASRQVNVAEDYNPGFINATYAKLNVERTKGSFGSVEVLWQVYKASSSLTSSVWDFIFYGLRGNDIQATAGRENSGTTALIFRASNASYVSVAPQNQPTSVQLQSGFTVSLWMKSNGPSNGTLIAKRSSTTNQIIFDLSMNTTGLVFRDNRYSYNVTFPSSVNMFDGQWHAVVFTASTSESKFYIDSKMIGSAITLKSTISTASGNIYLGCSLPTINHYTGVLQDVRMYPSVLISALIAEISTTRKVLTPTNGYLNYTEGTSMQEIFTKTIDNSKPEQDTAYIVKLIGVKAPGQLAGSGKIESRLTNRMIRLCMFPARMLRTGGKSHLRLAYVTFVLKSDGANGQFAFEPSICRASAMENQTNISFTVRRTIGSFGSVRVNWEIRQIGSSNLVASNDFVNAVGFVDFADGDNEKTIVIRPYDDTVPELDEKFELQLTSAVSLDGSVSSTPRSGATIKPNSNKCNVTISANDNPYGMLQIMPTKPTGSGIIQPLLMPLSVNVYEESGNVTLYVVRAQGVQGTISCEWKTNQHSAIGNVDFRQGIGSISFPQGANMTTLLIDLLDNNIPELEKSFTVQLYNPSGGAVLGSASYINITILPSDDAFGVFQFANTSLNVTVQEAPSVNAVFRVMRSGGTLGAANVTWLLSNGSTDFTVESGVVMFARGQRIGFIQIPVFDDTFPELTEAFTIRLISVSRGRLASSDLNAVVRITGNDDPYGIFEMLQSSIRVQERNATVSLTVSRQGGDIGMVRVFYRTSVSSSAGVVRNAATPDVDFASVSDSVIFQQGKRRSVINVTIFSDDIPEIDEHFMVNITNVVLLSSGEAIGNSPRIGSIESTTIIIEKNDNANGILQLSSSSLALHEGINGYFLNVTRSRGTFGTVSVRYAILDRGTTLGSDYQIASYLITLNNGQDAAAVPITIVNDAQPEFNESFVISLNAASLMGGAILGNPRECTVTIVENDNPYGLIGFASGSLNRSMQEPGSGQNVITLTVLRSGGTFGTVQVEWNATLNNQLASSDVTPSRGNVRFLSGQSSQDISISILADNVPENNEAIKVYLQYVSNGKASINEAAREATINIPPNDDPYGVVQFAQSTISVLEKETDYYIDLPVERTRGLFGSIKINHRTKDANTAMSKASSGSDYNPVIGNSMIMGPGIATSNITIQILKDNVPELGENFLVEITSAEVLGLPVESNTVKVVSPKIMNVTIIENDQPYGLFGVFITGTVTRGSSYAIIEPESGSTSITFEVRRSQGSLGIVSVAWRVSSASTVNISNDVSGVSGGRLTFTNAQITQDFNIAVNSDSIPESDEQLIIEIYDVQGGAVIDPATARAVLTIMANDDVGGRIGFSPGSRSKIVAEGHVASLNVYRTLPAAGNVTLNWTVTGVNASRDFERTSGKLLLLQGIANTMLRLITLNDSVPESHETFTVRLSAPATTGISSTGAATLVAGDSTATIIIGASDEPHGIIEFAPRDQPIRVNENVGHVDLRLVRNRGSIGQILVRYQIRGVQISQSITEGTYGQDFNSTANGTISIPDGSDSATIRVNIIDDNIPEQDEAFFVNITGVELVGSSNMTTSPKIGRLNYMQIQIEANDGTQGELAFAAKFARITVSEDIGAFNITVVRNKGLFGKVYAFYYLNRLTASTSDFDIPGGVMTGPARIEFADGQRERNITVFIHNDNITEPDEQFEIGLTIQNAENNGGVTIGSPDKSVVTISANDDANGVIQFAARSLMQYIAEPETVSSSNRTATFFVERKIGLFGTVNVQWRLLGVTNASDVSPFSGVVTFAPNDREKYFQIQAMMDNIPELKKTYAVQLTVISGGSRLGTPNTASLIIAANDGPHGFLSIRTYPSMSPSLNMEEKTQFVKAVVLRSGGTLGKISVQFGTKQGTAIAPNGTKIFYGFDHIFEARDAESVHSFVAYGQEYLILASSYRKQAGSLPVDNANPMEPYESTLFRWQGAFVPIITLKTDGCLKWKSFEENNTTYLVSVNHGSVGRYQTSSQVMKLHRNNTIELVQNITTQGASDVVFFRSSGVLYMITANMKDNSGNTNQQSQLLRWQGSRFSLESSSILTTGASALAVCRKDGMMFVAVANNYDSRSNIYGVNSFVYSWSDSTKRFTKVQDILTYAATDVKCTTIGGELYLLFTNSIENSRLYRYRTTSPPGFVEVQEIKTSSAQTGSFFNWNKTDYLVMSGNTSVIFEWNAARKVFANVSNIPVQNAVSVQPFTVTDLISGKLQYLAVTDGSKRRGYILRLDMLSENADFVPRRGLLTFYQGQASMRLDLTVLLDNRPEMDEAFSVELSSPTGGAELAANPNLAINILSNDNAYGRMAFTDASLRVNVTEQQWDSILKLDIIREFGSFGQVSLHWNISKLDGGSVVDLHPTNGQINLNQGISAASIYITVRADGIPELDEQFRVSLTRVSIAGSPNSNRGPSINHLKSSAVVTILANNDPYGIIGWKNRIEITTEETEVNSSALLVINRQAGTLGDIMVMYETQQALNVSTNERAAIPNVDYFTQRSSVLMKTGIREALVYVKVRHRELASDNLGGIKVTDNNTDVNEVFNVNITNVYLVSGARVPNSPRIDEKRRQVEVVITETVLNRGVVEFASPSMRRVSENVGVVILPLVRSNGSEGTVGVHFMVTGLNASSADFSPQNGLVTFSNNVALANLSITIVNDDIAELDEAFTVSLTKPSGGVKIGPSKLVQVTITESDYPYGLLEFNQASRVLNGIAEGQTVHLTVDRSQGSYRSVRVNWNCGSQSQNDFSPWNGQLVFAENSTRATITIQTINDTIPETSETFICMLSNPTNGAMISMNNNATISILPSDKPNGVISIAAGSRILTVGEPSGSYNGRFSISVLRSVGFDGLVTAHWRLNSVSGIDNSNITFNVTSGTVSFSPNNAMQNIFFQIQDDSTPEESRKYQLYLERATGGAELDIPANTKSEITVAASDNPYGMVQFVNSLPLNVTENTGYINITATRTGGLIGQLQVTFTTKNEGAVPGVDFMPTSGIITFNAGEGAKTIQFNIIDDTIPELTETFHVNMTSVRVITSKTLNFEVVNGLQVDIPPKIGSPSMVQISINENDQPYGEIRFLHSSRLVHERDGNILIPVNRTGGTFGTSVVSYTYTEGTAKNPADFTVSGSTLMFSPGETQKFIPVTILNDKLAEFQETFQLNITSINGLAAMGSIKTMTITIETSDNPYGLLGIYNTSLSVTVSNPATDRALSFPVSRIDGNLGVVQVSWRVLRTVQSASALTEDINPETGTLSFAAGQRGPKMINVTVRTYGGPQEPEESFILQVFSATGGAALDHAFTNVSITVQKKGHPRGLFRFDGTILPSQTITEPATGAAQILVPVKRDFGSQGTVNVGWSISSSAGSVRRDLVFANTTLRFSDGVTMKNIKINVTADSYPELDQVYELELVSADNGAEIDMGRKKINFTVRANDYPHGLFSLVQASKRFEFIPSTMVRRLHFTVERKHGTIGNVQANIEVKYEESKTANFESVTLANGQSTLPAMFNISSSLFVAFGRNFTVRIKDVNVIGQASTMKPAVDGTTSPLQIAVPEEAANSLVEFDASTRYPVAVQAVEGYQVSNVLISRRGLFGNITVEWRTGYPTGAYTIGSITPTQGSLSFSQGERSKAISFQITLPTTLQDRLVYAVYLSSVSPAVGQPAHPRISAANTAIADPHGLVEIAPNNRSITVVEGKKAKVFVRRLLSTVGTIRIGYTTQKYVGSNAATENSDFTPVTSTFDMIDGQATRTIEIDTIEDSAGQAEKDELFYVVLTSLQVVAGKLSANSPRLSITNTRAIVTIRDNDNPFGVISFTAQSISPTTQESAGQLMLRLQRTGGVFSRVTVLIRSIGGGEPWQDSVINGLPSSSPIRTALNARTKVASAVNPNQDYLPLNKEVVFEELNTIPNGGQIKTVNISILQDALAEPAEQIVVVLSNTTGGASLPSNTGSLKAFSVITIDGNGLWNGEIGFTVNNAVINEDGTAEVILPLQRNKGAAESIEVSWQVWSTISGAANELVVSSGKTSFAAGNTTSSLTISLKKDTTPEFASWFYINLTTSANGAIIAGAGSGLFSFCNITMLESDYPAGRIGFSDVYRFPVVTLGTRSKQLTVRRYDGKLKEVTVRYQTSALISVLSDGNIVMTPAIENKDFKSASGILTFPKGGAEAFINIELTPNTASVGAYPKVFNVTLFSPTNGAILNPSHKSEQIIISNDRDAATFLRFRSSALRIPLSDTEIENVMLEMLSAIKVQPLSDMNQNLAIRTIRIMIAYKASLPAGQRAFTNKTKSILLDIYDPLLLSTRTDTRGKSDWALLLDELAYAFLNDMSCPHTFTGTKSNFALTSRRDKGSNLNGVKFTSGRNADFFRYPVNMFSSSSPCTDLHFIDYGNQQFFSSGKSVLNSKVMSSEIKSGLSSGMKVVYRVHTSKTRVTSKGVSCVIWQHATAGTKGDWNTKNCKVKGETKTYVECECQHLSQYAVLALSDNRTGYETYFFVACFICIGACFFALMAHHLCAYETTFTANLLMHMIFAIMMTNILYAVGGYISPTLMNKPTNCAVLGVAIHYFFLTQFSWMFVQGWNLWRILVLNDEHSDRKFVAFFLMGYGLPVLIVVGYVFITYAVYRWPFTTMYGDVHSNGDMCFMTNDYAALGSVIIPVILFVVAVAVVFLQSYQLRPQWKCYDDVYRGRYNIKEMRHLIAIYALLFITWLFAGLHLAFGSLWMIITFTALNIILGLYILVVYAIIRNQMRYLCHGEYAVRAAPSLISDHELIYAPGSLNQSAMRRKFNDTQSQRSNRLSDWEDVELPVNLNPMDFPDKERIIDSPDAGRVRGRVNESYDNDMDSDEFDDLIFALKTGGRLTPSVHEEQELEEKMATPRSMSGDQPQIRRIKIADTHL